MAHKRSDRMLGEGMGLSSIQWPGKLNHKKETDFEM